MSPSGLFVLRVRASDADLGDNARMTYSLEGNASPIWSLRKESTFFVCLLNEFVNFVRQTRLKLWYIRWEIKLPKHL